MRLSSLSFASLSFARLSSAAAVLLLFSLFSISVALAQHGGGGVSGGGGGSFSGGSSSGGSSSGGSSGGSHGGGGGGYSGGSSSAHGGGSFGSGSSASHGSSSSGSSSHGSSSHGSFSHASSGHGDTSISPPSNRERIQNLTRVPILEPVEKSPQRGGILSFLTRPFRKPQPERVSAFERRMCWRGNCRVCPVAQVPGAGGCFTPNLYLQNTGNCSHVEIWGGLCVAAAHVFDDCSGLRTAMEQQARRMQAAEQARQNGCSNALAQECTDLTSKAQNETNLYQTLQQRFNQCRARSHSSQSYRNNSAPFHDFGDFGVDIRSAAISNCAQDEFCEQRAAR